MENCNQNNNEVIVKPFMDKKEIDGKFTEEEIKEINEYGADVYHRAIVKMTFGNYDNVEDIQKIGRDAILDFSSHTLEICNKHKTK
jgi:hypothetical protein